MNDAIPFAICVGSRFYVRFFFLPLAGEKRTAKFQPQTRPLSLSNSAEKLVNIVISRSLEWKAQLRRIGSIVIPKTRGKTARCTSEESRLCCAGFNSRLNEERGKRDESKWDFFSGWALCRNHGYYLFAQGTWRCFSCRISRPSGWNRHRLCCCQSQWFPWGVEICFFYFLFCAIFFSSMCTKNEARVSYNHWKGGIIF